MLESKLLDVLKLVPRKGYISSVEIALKLGISEKTVRTRIKQLNKIMDQAGAKVVGKAAFGYQLTVTHEEALQKVLFSIPVNRIPNTNEDRVDYLLQRLIDQGDWVKLDDLAESLYISKTVLSKNLVAVEQLVTRNNLVLERKPNYGMKVSGSEFHRRICLIKTIYDKYEHVEAYKNMEEIGRMIVDINQAFNVKMNEVTLDFFIKYMSVSIYRIKKDFSIREVQEKINSLSQATLMLVDRIVEQLEKRFALKVDSHEKYYMSVFYGATIASDSYSDFGPNFVISSNINEIVFKMLASVRQTLSIDFTDNLELRMSLNQHLVPMDIRIRYNIEISNPLLAQIKQEYPFAYTVAVNAVLPLRDIYKNEISEDEIGFIAVLFALALEKNKHSIRRKNIVIVCATGKGTAQLFTYRFKKAFSHYLENVYVTSPTELTGYDFAKKKIDFVFTTVQLSDRVPVPVCEIDLFFDKQEVVEYSQLFETSEERYIGTFFSQELFIPRLKASTKEEALMTMVHHVNRYIPLPADFMEALLKREAMGLTEFGSGLAIPHPNRLMTDVTFAVMAVLDHPLKWGDNSVHAILMFAIGTEENAKLEKFYDVLSNFIFDEVRIQKVVENPTFENFTQVLLADNRMLPE